MRIQERFLADASRFTETVILSYETERHCIDNNIGSKECDDFVLSVIAEITEKEPKKSFMQGIKKIVGFGSQPIISIFRPLPDTPLKPLMAPPLTGVYDLYCKAEKVCKKNGLRLDSACVFCQNNTLNLPEGDESLPPVLIRRINQ